MTNITNYLNKIKTAVYGKDVRGAIHDAIKQVYDDASVDHDNANMEVKLARGTHNTLNDRLDNADEIQAQTNAQLSFVEKESNSSISDKIRIKKRNKQGLYAINLCGDSITHGANAPVMSDDSWAGIVRKALQIEFNTSNYGYVSAYGVISNNAGRYQDYISLSDKVPGWSRKNTTDTLGFFKRSTDVVGATIRGALTEYVHRKKLGIAVIKDVNGGEIEVKVSPTFTINSITETFDLSSQTKVNDIVWIDIDGLDKLVTFEIKNLSGTNTITGFYIIDDLDNIVVNNYARTGARLDDLSDELIDNVFDCEALLFSLGYNRTNDMDLYLEKCKNAYNTYKPAMYVLDFCWDKSRDDISDKLKKFAGDLKVPYIKILEESVVDAQDLVNDGFLSDTSHPSVEGHRIIAEKVLSVLKTSFLNKKAIEMFKEKVAIVDEINDGTVIYSGKYDKSDANYNLFKDIKMGIEITLIRGNVTNVYLQKFADGRLYVMGDSHSSSISSPIQNGKGLKTIGNGYVNGIEIAGVIEFAEDYTAKIAAIPDSTKIKINGAIVTNITTEKTNVLEYIKFN